MECFECGCEIDFASKTGHNQNCSVGLKAKLSAVTAERDAAKARLESVIVDRDAAVAERDAARAENKALRQMIIRKHDWVLGSYSYAIPFEVLLKEVPNEAKIFSGHAWFTCFYAAEAALDAALKEVKDE